MYMKHIKLTQTERKLAVDHLVHCLPPGHVIYTGAYNCKWKLHLNLQGAFRE